MDLKERKEDKILETATEILVADIQNGLRKYWIYEMDDAKLDKLIDKSINIAGKLVNKIIPD